MDGFRGQGGVGGGERARERFTQPNTYTHTRLGAMLQISRDVEAGADGDAVVGRAIRAGHWNRPFPPPDVIPRLSRPVTAL